jgi:hypothetical protein
LDNFISLFAYMHAAVVASQEDYTILHAIAFHGLEQESAKTVISIVLPPYFPSVETIGRDEVCLTSYGWNRGNCLMSSVAFCYI